MEIIPQPGDGSGRIRRDDLLGPIALWKSAAERAVAGTDLNESKIPARDRQVSGVGAEPPQPSDSLVFNQPNPRPSISAAEIIVPPVLAAIFSIVALRFASETILFASLRSVELELAIAVVVGLFVGGIAAVLMLSKGRAQLSAARSAGPESYGGLNPFPSDSGDCAGAIANLEALNYALGSTDELSKRLNSQIHNSLTAVVEIGSGAEQKIKESIGSANFDISLLENRIDLLVSRLSHEIINLTAIKIDEIALAHSKTIEDAMQDADKALEAFADSVDARILKIANSVKSVSNEIFKLEDRVDFAPTLSALIGVLKKHSISISRIYSIEISTSVWRRYLSGDRNAFSRRSLHLLLRDQRKRISKIYRSDVSARDNIDSYIAVFEDMLKIVFAQRMGTTLAVALLTSDVGKLYLALSRGIDRIRLT